MKLKKYIPQITSFGFYKHFPLLWILGLIPFYLCIFLCFNFIEGSTLSLKQVIVVSVVSTIAYHMPSCLSSLLMKSWRKPILTFTSKGFYYTPQLWSKSQLHKWTQVKHIQILHERDEENCSESTFVNIYLTKSCISINEKLLPIQHQQLTQIFRQRLPSIPITKQFHSY